jgi:hypothetical protein
MCGATIRNSKVIVTIATALFGASSRPLAAQNPIQAAKDAYNKTKQQPGNQQNSGQKPVQGGTQGNDSGPFTPPAGTKIDPVVMAPVSAPTASTWPRCLTASGSRAVMIYDGVAGPKFDQIFGQSTGMVGVVFSPEPQWSADSKHLFTKVNAPQRIAAVDVLAIGGKVVPGSEIRLFADGKPVLEGAATSSGGFAKDTLQMDPSASGLDARR